MSLLEVETKRPLPSETRDMARAFADLETFGYCVIADALTPQQVRALRARLSDQAHGEDAAGAGSHDSKANQRVWMLPNKGRMFRDLVLHPLAQQMMGRLLDQDYLLSSLTANIARPGGELMWLHTDQYYTGFWTPVPVVANIAWMLDDFTEENGGTRLIPGSHLYPRRPEDGQEQTVAAEGSAGSALVFDGRLVHGTGANRTASQERHAILSYYCRPFMRQQENFFVGLAPDILASEREEFLARLGYLTYAGLGRIDAPRQGVLVSQLDRSAGPLSADGKAAADGDAALP